MTHPALIPVKSLFQRLKDLKLDVPGHMEGITIRQLRSYQSGRRHYKTYAHRNAIQHFSTLQEALEFHSTDPLLFEPGTDWVGIWLDTPRQRFIIRDHRRGPAVFFISGRRRVWQWRFYATWNESIFYRLLEKWRILGRRNGHVNS
jgi:hypothetical protein